MRTGFADMECCPYTWASRAEKGMQFCRKGRRAADIDYVQLWTRCLIAHIVSLFIGLDREQEAWQKRRNHTGECTKAKQRVPGHG